MTDTQIVDQLKAASDGLLMMSESEYPLYRVGEIEIDVYIVGETTEGNLAGLSTKVVET
ncbi:nuclease A inhibitor family protein [Pelatocladus sp. BLCC-F211]|uniref:nuclease A inhibitor family protein n=1 Tax=Pelatocladus sp. BLCC-F211 TaxID=3342752 RepID=UPI0035B948D2